METGLQKMIHSFLRKNQSISYGENNNKITSVVKGKTAYSCFPVLFQNYVTENVNGIRKDGICIFSPGGEKYFVENEEFQNFKSYYDTFEKAVGDILLLISTKIAEIDAKAYITDKEVDDTTGEETTEKFTLEKALNWYDENPNAYTGIYTAKGEEDYSNRYCIYWYRYVPGYIAPNEEYDFAGNEWERIIPKTNVDGTLI
jgi:hypothetical protein